ncbi:MAG: RluA family pseudouridine synthase [Lachnospiraceae bacterium]|nr:RluA family pseudouridine synthase [Lachnospiraceae bacterium]
MQKFIIGKNQAGQRFDKFLQKFMPEAGSGFLYKMLRKKNITLNGKKAEGKEILNPGDEVNFFFADETFEKFTGRKADSDTKTSVKEVNVGEYKKAYEVLKGIEVIYEDENVLFVNKPVGVLTQKATPTDISLNEWLIGYLLHHQKITSQELSLFKPSVCNRLDRNTSGLVLCGKSLAGSQGLSKLIHDRAMNKYYRTICIGQIDSGATITGSLKKDHQKNIVTVSVEGSQIQTAYEPIQSLSGGRYTYLEVDLITGKTHQIRAHLASVGHALIGDVKYGIAKENTLMQKRFQLKNQLLHAYRVEFPALEGALSDLSERCFDAPLPEKFSSILKELT